MSEWACFVFKHAKNGYPWLLSWWVTWHSLFSSLLKTAALCSLDSGWQSLLCYQSCWISCALLFRGWVSGLVLFSSLLKMVVLDCLGCKWLNLHYFQACWIWLSLALQYVSDWPFFVFNTAKNGCPWFSSQWVTKDAFFKPAENSCPWLSRRWVTGLAIFKPVNLQCLSLFS